MKKINAKLGERGEHGATLDKMGRAGLWEGVTGEQMGKSGASQPRAEQGKA